jgi:TolA-binding protein
MMKKLHIAVLLFALCSLTSVAQDSKENAEFKLAVGLYKDGMYDLAVEQFKNFISAYPNTAQGIDARFTLGLAQMKLKRFDEARMTFQNFALAYVEHPKAPEAWMSVGDAFLALTNEQEAASAYERVKVFHPKSPLVPEALLKAGQLYRRIGDLENAKKDFRTIIQDYPTSKSVLAARLAIGELYADEGQIALAEQEARRVSDSDAPPEVKAAALFTIGKLNVMRSRFDDAEAIFRRVAVTYKKTPAATAAAFELGKLALGIKQYPAAIEQFNSVAIDDAAEDSLQSEVFYWLGRSYALHSEHVSAQKAFVQLFTKFPKSSLAARALLEAEREALLNTRADDAFTYMKKNLSLSSSPLKRPALIVAATASETQRPTEASRLYSAYIDSFPHDPFLPDVMMKLGSLLLEKMQDARTAGSVFENIVQKFPQSDQAAKAMVKIGQCREEMKDFDGALRVYTDLQRLYPAHDAFDEIQKRIAVIEHHFKKNRDGGMEKLAQLIGKVLSEKPSGGTLSFQLGEIYFNDMKDYVSAAQQFTTASTSGLDDTHRSDALFYRARSYHFQSELDTLYTQKAISAYDEFLKNFPAAAQSDDAAFFVCEIRSSIAPPAERIRLAADFLKAFPNSHHRDNALLKLGMSAFDGGNYREALNAFGVIVAGYQQFPLLSSTFLSLGNAYQKLNIMDSAIISWKQAASFHSTDPSVTRALWNIATYFRQNKNHADALTTLRKLSAEYSYCQAGQQASDMLPEEILLNGEYDDAIQMYEHQIEEEKNSPFVADVDASLYFHLAQAYEKKGDRQHAIDYYTQYLSGERTGQFASAAFYSLGSLARAEGNTGAASSYFKQAAILGGTSSASRDIAELLFQTEQYPEAVKQYTQLAASTDSVKLRQLYQSRVIVSILRMDKIAEAQKMIEVFEKTFGEDKIYRAEFEFEKGNSFYRSQDYVSAKKVFEKLAGDYEETHFGPWGWYYLSKISEVNNKLEDAAKRYENVLKKFPSSDVVPRALLSLGNMHFNAERFENAIQYYQQITAAPEQAGDILPYAMNNLIEAYESTKLYDAALKTTRDFIERYPNDESISDKKIKVGTLYTKLGYYDQAILQFQNLINESGSMLEAELRYDIGEAYYNKGDYQQAILEFLKVPYLVSRQGKVNWTATAFYMAGQSYEKMSKFDEAIGMYQQVIERPGIDATFKAAAKKEIDRVKAITKKGR